MMAPLVLFVLLAVVVTSAATPANASATYSVQTSGSDVTLTAAEMRISARRAAPPVDSIYGTYVATDTDLVFSLSTDSKPSLGRQNAVVLLRHQSAGTNYRVRSRFLPDGRLALRILRAVNGTVRGLTTSVIVPNVKWSSTAPVRVRTRIFGTSPTTIRVKAWPAGKTQPSGWHLSVTDRAAALQGDGGLGLRVSAAATRTSLSSTSTQSVAFSFTNVKAEGKATGPKRSDPTPTPTPKTTPAPVVKADAVCPSSFKAGVDDSAVGGTLDLRGCSYPGNFTISKSMTVLGGKITGRVFVSANDVTLDGVEVVGGDAKAQNGQVHVRNSERFTLRNAYVHHGGGAGVSIDGGSGHRIIDSELAYMEQQGFHLPRVQDTLVKGNRIHHNNPNWAYDWAWEAGAGKAVRTLRLTFEGNRVYANNGFGLWCDIYCRKTTYRNNRIYNNTHSGIHEEVSYDALIEGNVLYNNGNARHGTWWWGTNLLLSSATGATIRNNVVAYGWAGISVISQARNDWPEVHPLRDIRVEGNTVIGTERMIGWVDPDKMGLFNSDRNNTGKGNFYWHKDAETTSCRFEWSGCKNKLGDYNNTPGESGGTYLTLSERNAILDKHGIPRP
ncbi:hypothetical protein BH23CHL7_BH23CHL7_06610 [soil metagenome]